MAGRYGRDVKAQTTAKNRQNFRRILVPKCSFTECFIINSSFLLLSALKAGDHIQVKKISLNVNHPILSGTHPAVRFGHVPVKCRPNPPQLMFCRRPALRASDAFTHQVPPCREASALLNAGLFLSFGFSPAHKLSTFFPIYRAVYVFQTARLTQKGIVILRYPTQIREKLRRIESQIPCHRKHAGPKRSAFVHLNEATR